MTIPIKIISKEEFLKLNKKPSQEQVWDDIADTWKEYRNVTLPVVYNFLKNKKGLVVDIGCGSGRNIIENMDLTYYCVDISKKQLELTKIKAKETGINVKFFKNNADKLSSEFKDNMFDYGLFIATLHCIETKKDRVNALKEFYRVLKPGAFGLITTWNSEDKRFNCVNNSGDIYMNWKVNGKDNFRYYYLFKKQELVELINKAGLEIIEFCLAVERDRFLRKNWVVVVKKA